MERTLDIPRTIGICGAAGCGKDTLCNALITIIGSQLAKRFSIAGDKIREDLRPLIHQSMFWDITELDRHQKETVRPLMVEYGRMMRNTTLGRYFITYLENKPTFQDTSIRIIPDIRYDEFQYDERHWLKEEQRGFLIYVDRKNTPPANKYEEKNLQNLRLWADHVVYWDTLENIEQDALLVANQIINSYFTINHSDTVPPAR